MLQRCRNGKRRATGTNLPAPRRSDRLAGCDQTRQGSNFHCIFAPSEHRSLTCTPQQQLLARSPSGATCAWAGGGGGLQHLYAPLGGLALLAGGRAWPAERSYKLLPRV